MAFATIYRVSAYKFLTLSFLLFLSGMAWAQVPADFSAEGGLIGTTDETDPHKVVLSILLPDTGQQGEPMSEPFTELQIKEYNNMTGSEILSESIVDGLELGATITHTIEGVSEGSHYYYVRLFSASGSNSSGMVSVFVGTDAPGYVENLRVESVDNGYLVSWEAPVVGLNGGRMGDLSQITFTVKRGADEYDANAVVIAQDISELSVFDEISFEEETMFCYLVSANSPYGNGYAKVSRTVVDGPASELPYNENFDQPFDEYGNTTFEHNCWSKSYGGGWYCNWQIGQDTYVDETSVKPHNGKGMLFAWYSPWSNYDCWDALTSGHINFEGVYAPQITFWLYDYDTLESTASIKLRIQTSSDDINFIDAAVIAIGNAEKRGWRKVLVALDAAKNTPCVSVRLVSEVCGTACKTVILDEIGIANDPAAIESIGQQDGEHVLPIFNLSGQPQCRQQRGLQIVEGRAVVRR